MYRLAKSIGVAAILGGLCSGIAANSTTSSAHRLPASAIHLVQTDLSLAPAAVAPVEETRQAVAAPIKIALLLPLKSQGLRPAAEAVQAGFLAAAEREREGVNITVVETGDDAQDVVAGYATASAQNDLVVGPLSRSGVTALAESGAIDRPTIALTQLETAGGVKASATGQLLVVGLSIEEEARQVAAWAGANRALTRALVISTSAGWQQRAAAAFVEQWQKQGREAEITELQSYGGYLEAKELQDLRSTLVADKSTVVFLALDAVQARQLRAIVGNALPMYGTSQLNPFTFAGRSHAEATPVMDGVRLVDIPWQVRPFRAMEDSVPQQFNPGQKRDADLERLYALGMDAYRIAKEIADRRYSFDMDGATGKLTVRFDQSSPVFDRKEERAVYRDGVVVPFSDLR